MSRIFPNRPALALLLIFIPTILLGTSAKADTDARFRAALAVGPALKVATDRRPLGVQASALAGLNLIRGFSLELVTKAATFGPTLDTPVPYSLALVGLGVAYEVDAFSSVSVRLSAIPFGGLAFEGRTPTLRLGALVGATFLVPLNKCWQAGLNLESPIMLSSFASELEANPDAAIFFASAIFVWGPR